MMGGMISAFGNALAVTKQSADYRRFAEDQQNKADDFSQKAGQVVTEQVTNDPAYILKEYLANNGMPGLQQYLDSVDKSVANNISTAENSASSGGALLSYLSSLMGAANEQKNKLYGDSASFIAQQKSNLADFRYGAQKSLDELAREERAKLNRIASQYQAAADANMSEANNMDSALISSTFNSMGSMMGGFGGGASGGGASRGGGMGGSMGATLGGMIGG